MRLLQCIGVVAILTLLFCGLATAQVIINEIMINDHSTDDSTYVEIYGPSGTSLTGYQLVAVNGYNGSEYRWITLSGSIPTDGFYVIGQSANVPNVDLVNPDVDLQNGPDNVVLKLSGNIVDAVGYGTFSPDTNFVGEGQPAPNCVPGFSLNRYPDGNDTNNNYADFTLSEFLTPGEPNIVSGEEPPYYSLLELRTLQPVDSLVWTSGIATVEASLFGGASNISAYMQDEEAGINIFGGTFSFAPGDCLWVKGTISIYSGLLEIYYPLVINMGPNVSTPDPILVDCQLVNASGEALEGMLVQMDSVWITASSEAWPIEGSNANLTITDASGSTVVLRIDKDTELDGWTDHPEPEEPFVLTAIVNEYSVYQ
ncbi:MAG: hypothetical protein ABH878_04000, partial [bacterium]